MVNFSDVKRKKSSRQTAIDLIITIAFLCDLMIVTLSLIGAFWIRFKSGWIPEWHASPTPLSLNQYYRLIAVGIGSLMTVLLSQELYNPDRFLSYRITALSIIRASTLWLLAYLGLTLTFYFEPPVSRVFVSLSYLFSMVGLLFWRRIFRNFFQFEKLSSLLRRRIVLIGWNDQTTKVFNAIAHDQVRPYEIVGTVPPASGRFYKQPPSELPILGDYNSLSSILEQHRIEILLLADLEAVKGEIAGLMELCEKSHVEFRLIPYYFQILVSRLHLEPISGVPVLGISKLPLDWILNRAMKRSLDIIGSIIGLILSTPIMLICAALIYRESPGPIFYRQTRVGRRGDRFQIVKLRSMRLDAEPDGPVWTQKDDPRCLRIGVFMRQWNLDELPQFWNVLKGEMSLVGPRPERPELISNFSETIPHYSVRHECKAGMTGWAQVNGLRGNTDLKERVQYDLYYLENWQLGFDLYIIALTFFRRKNAY